MCVYTSFSYLLLSPPISSYLLLSPPISSYLLLFPPISSYLLFSLFSLQLLNPAYRSFHSRLELKTTGEDSLRRGVLCSRRSRSSAQANVIVCQRLMDHTPLSASPPRRPPPFREGNTVWPICCYSNACY